MYRRPKSQILTVPWKRKHAESIMAFQVCECVRVHKCLCVHDHNTESASAWIPQYNPSSHQIQMFAHAWALITFDSEHSNSIYEGCYSQISCMFISECVCVGRRVRGIAVMWWQHSESHLHRRFAESKQMGVVIKNEIFWSIRLKNDVNKKHFRLQ